MFPITGGIGLFITGYGCGSVSFTPTVDNTVSRPSRNEAASGRLLKTETWAKLISTDQLKCDGTRTETRFRLSAKRKSPFKSAGASVQSTTGS